MRTPLFLLTATALMSATIADAQYQQPQPYQSQQPYQGQQPYQQAPSAPRYLAQSDVQEAAKQHPAVIAEFGGAETGARAAYVENVGRRVASFTGTANAGQAYHFTTLNSAVENAFSVPGGYVYITRQLMGLMNDEAELAFVVGHETGHIAANHARQRQKVSQRNSILGVLGAVLGSVVGGGFGNIIAQGSQYSSQLRTLSFSRNQEYQADQLGIRYITQAGYDPNGATTMLQALSRSSALQARLQGKGSRSTPEWASTHPLSENRVSQAAQLVRQTGRAGTGMRNRDQFLAQVNGIYVDDDPAQGVIDGRTFTHPDLKLQFAVPAGYLMQNSTEAVTIEGTAGQAQFSGGRYDGNIQTYIQKVINDLTEGKIPVQLGQPQRTMINGIPATYVGGQAQTSSGVVGIEVMAYEWGPNTAYHFVTLTRGGNGYGQSPFGEMFNSMRRVSPAEASAIKPRIIQVMTVKRGDTVDSFASRMAYRDFQRERFVSLNGLNGAAALVPGQKVKVVVFGARRG